MRRALIVGIDDYPDSPLEGCINDANAINDIIRCHQDGAPNFDTMLLTSDEADITRPVLREAITTLFATECEIALLYFSGHGYLGGTDGYVVTRDATVYDEGIPMSEILTLANRSPARSNVVILDCCHSGQMGAPVPSDSGLSQLSEGLTVLTASRASEPSLEEDGSGVFTSLVVDGLRGGAADLLGHVTPGALYSYVDRALGAWDQRPIFKANVTSFTSLRSVEPPVPLAVLRKLPEYFAEPSAEHQLSPEYEFTEPDHDPEKVVILKDLQKMVAVGLVVPVDEEFMYFAAMNSKSCRLTPVGRQYWRLACENKI